MHVHGASVPALLLVLPSLVARASEPVGPEDSEIEASFPSSPPISIDDTEPVDPHHFEINITSGFVGKGGNWESETPLFDVNYGLMKNVQINAEIPYVFGEEDNQPKHGFGTAAAAVKVRVLDKKRVHLTLHPAIEFPPLPAGAYDASGPVTVTVPVSLNVAVGKHGGGFGFNLSRAFTAPGTDDTWGAAVGYGHPLGETGDILFDYAQEADPHLHLGEGWVEVGYTRGNLFGSEHLMLLSALGLSTQADVSALLGVQVSI